MEEVYCKSCWFYWDAYTKRATCDFCGEPVHLVVQGNEFGDGAVEYANAPTPVENNPSKHPPLVAMTDILREQRKNICHGMLVSTESGSVMYISSIEENPHAKVGTMLYSRFFEAWQRVPDNPAVGTVMGPGSTLRAMSATQCHILDGNKILAVALLMDKSGLTIDGGTVIVVHKPEHELLLPVITLEHTPKSGEKLSGFTPFAMEHRK